MTREEAIRALDLILSTESRAKQSSYNEVRFFVPGKEVTEYCDICENYGGLNVDWDNTPCSGNHTIYEQEHYETKMEFDTQGYVSLMVGCFLRHTNLLHQIGTSVPSGLQLSARGYSDDQKKRMVSTIISSVRNFLRLSPNEQSRKLGLQPSNNSYQSETKQVSQHQSSRAVTDFPGSTIPLLWRTLRVNILI